MRTIGDKAETKWLSALDGKESDKRPAWKGRQKPDQVWLRTPHYFGFISSTVKSHQNIPNIEVTGSTQCMS